MESNELMRKKAFTLAELLIAVIILGIATASIVPILTKKLLKTENEAKNKAYVSFDCKEIVNEYCSLCDKKYKYCYTCELKCPTGYLAQQMKLLVNAVILLSNMTA